MVEQFNRSLLQLLRCYTETEDDWEEFLLLVLYAYHTAIHSSTNVSPFQLMFGRSPAVTPFQCPYKFDSTNYASHLKAKLQAMQNLVRTRLNVLSSKKDNTTVTRCSVPSMPSTLYGYRYQQQKNYSLTGMENGLSVK